MPDLVDVLNSSKDRKEVAELGVLDTEIPLNLQALSAIVEKEFQSSGLSFYSNALSALSNFSQGFGDGTRNSQNETGMPDSYNLGYNLGTSLAHPPAGMEESYMRAKGQCLIV